MPERDPLKVTFAVVISVIATAIGLYNFQWYLKTVSDVLTEIEQRVNK